METIYSAEYYKKNRKQFEGKKGTINPEKDLFETMNLFTEITDEQQRTKLRKLYAGRVYEKNKYYLLKEKELYLKVRSGKANLGFTNASQEIKEKARIIMLFEYNCFILGEFKKNFITI